MAVTYAYCRHFGNYETSYDTIEDATLRAWSDLEWGEAWPKSISDDGQILWQSDGPLDCSESLEAFAGRHGIKLQSS